MTNSEVKEVESSIKSMLKEGGKQTKIIARAKKAQKRIIAGESLKSVYTGEVKTLDNPTIEDVSKILEDKGKAVIINGQLVTSLSSLDDTIKGIQDDISSGKINSNEDVKSIKGKLEETMNDLIDESSLTDDGKADLMDKIEGMNKSNAESVLNDIKAVTDEISSDQKAEMTNSIDVGEVSVYDVNTKQMAKFKEDRGKMPVLTGLRRAISLTKGKANLKVNLSPLYKFGKGG